MNSSVRFFTAFATIVLLIPCISNAAPSERAQKSASKSDMGTSSPDYKKASAHVPLYSDKELWPHLTGKEAFTKQEWLTTRVLVWAHQGAAATKGKKPDDGANWLENGQSATAPPDETTDVVFPASTDGKLYLAEGVRNFTCRHITIEENASIKSAGMFVHGNFWLKRGGKIRVMGPMSIVGSGHGFMRVEGQGESGTSKDTPARHTPQLITQYLTLNRVGGSIELIGSFGSGDEFKVFGGTEAILHPNAQVCWGRNATLHVYKGAVVTLMDGSRYYKWVNQFGRMGDAVVAGTVRGGSPGRPLTTSETFFGLSFNNWTGADFPLPEDEEQAEKANNTRNKRFYGLVLKTGAQLATHSQNPDTARLVIGWHGIELSQYIHESGTGEYLDPAFKEPFESIPRQVTIFFEPGVSVEGVTFDDVHPGGLLMKNQEEAKQWKEVRYGKNIGAPPEKLIAPAPEK